MRQFNRNVLFIFNIYILLFITSCSALSPVRTTSSEGFSPKSINAIVVQVESDYIKRSKNRGLTYQLESEVVSELMDGGYRVMSRSDIKDLEKEIKFQNNQRGLEDPAQMGYFDGVPAKLIIKITKVITEPKSILVKNGKKERQYIAHISVSARLLNLQSSQILWTATLSQSRQIQKSMEINAIQATVLKLINALPDRS